jgi:hypothetical protein
MVLKIQIVMLLERGVYSFILFVSGQKIQDIQAFNKFKLTV